jgi:hypothetical protein
MAGGGRTTRKTAGKTNGYPKCERAVRGWGLAYPLSEDRSRLMLPPLWGRPTTCSESPEFWLTCRVLVGTFGRMTRKPGDLTAADRRAVELLLEGGRIPEVALATGLSLNRLRYLRYDREDVREQFDLAEPYLAHGKELRVLMGRAVEELHRVLDEGNDAEKMRAVSVILATATKVRSPRPPGKRPRVKPDGWEGLLGSISTDGN